MKSLAVLAQLAFALAVVVAQQPSGGGAPAEAKPSAQAAGSSEARDLLKKADEAVKAVKAVRYEADIKTTGALVQMLPSLRGTATMAGKSSDPQNPYAKFYCVTKFKMPDSSEELEITAGSDGDKYFMIDPTAKMAYEDIDPSVLGRRGSVARGIAIRKFSSATPYAEELAGTQIELKGSATFDGHECQEIYVVYAADNRSGAKDATYWLSKKDLLPRKIIRTFQQGDQSGAAEILLTKLTVDPKLDPDPFKLVVPDGFKKTDEPAP